ncbi:hypothetical protein [Stutzerimonas stutzeri]
MHKVILAEREMSLNGHILRAEFQSLKEQPNCGLNQCRQPAT